MVRVLQYLFCSQDDLGLMKFTLELIGQEFGLDLVSFLSQVYGGPGDIG